MSCGSAGFARLEPFGFQKALLGQPHQDWVERAGFQAGANGQVVAVMPVLAVLEERGEQVQGLCGNVLLSWHR